MAPLSWWMSKPIVICCYDEFDDKYYTFNDSDPKLLLQKFCTLLVREFPNHVLCGKNSQNFDNPCVTGWLIRYDLGVPEHFKRHIRGPLTDIDQIFGIGSMAQQRTTLDNYAYGMGIQQKIMNGAGVGDLYRSYLMGIRPDGMDELVDYCKQDVKITSEMRRRFLKPFTPLKVESEVDSVVDLANVF